MLYNFSTSQAVTHAVRNGNTSVTMQDSGIVITVE